MNIEELKKLTKNDVLTFIRKELRFENGVMMSLGDNDVHKRFNMSGYDYECSDYDGVIGSCTVWNQSVLNTFAYLGIYDYTDYLFLDFYKGNPTLYLKYFNSKENLEYEFGGYSTSNIIYDIFQLTIFSNNGTRRRV